MARIRSIKPTFWTDEKLGLLHRDTRTCFLGLISAMADDHGRCVGNPRIVRGAVFPFDDDITAADVVPMLEQLAAIGRILRYQVNGDDYIQITNWTKHQRVDRPAPSLLPPPPDDSSNDRRMIVESTANDRRPIPTEVEGEREREKDRDTPPPPPRDPVLVGLEDFADPRCIAAVLEFLECLPNDTARPGWLAEIRGWREGLTLARNQAASEADIACALSDYVALPAKDFNRRHVRRFVEKAREDRNRPARASPGSVAEQTRAAAREVSAATAALFRRPGSPA